MRSRYLHTLLQNLFLLTVMATAVSDAWSQQFKVMSFRELPNDVSAFINPVRDLNDEDCALLKIVASPEFVFSTPLGIVKRLENTGEIWLYLPPRSKKITIKHAEWGVLRDYEFPKRLESHKTYEIAIKEPEQKMIVSAPEKIVTTIRDTLVLTRVDTLVVTPHRQPVPIETAVLACIGYGGKANYLTGGLMASVMKRHGAFLHILTDFGSIGKTAGVCDRDGSIDGTERYYSGETRRKAFTVTGGAIHRAGRHLSVFEGIGYSAYALAWRLADSEGGEYVKNSHYSVSGFTAEAGLMVKFNKITISASVVTVKGKDWFGSAGIGIRFGRKEKHTSRK